MHRLVNASCAAVAWASLFGCGGSSQHEGAPGAAGRAGAAASPGGSGGASGNAGKDAGSGADGGKSSPSAGGNHSAGEGAGGNHAGEGATGAAGGAGGRGTAGNATGGGGLSNLGGSGGTAGASAGTDAEGGGGGLAGAASGEPGIVCGAWDNTLPDVACAAGEVCVLCEGADASRSVRCAPNPSAQPDEYAAFGATCMNGTLLTECDGPEDCPDGTTCQLRADDDYAYAGCSPAPPSCDAYCVACNSSNDCSGDDRCVPNELGSGDWHGRTCGPGLDDLLTQGDWLMGWSGDLDHYAWFRFSRDAADSRRGTVKTLPAACRGCSLFGCGDGDGTYEIVAEKDVSIAVPSSCTFTYALTNVTSPPVPRSSSWGSQAVLSAQVTVEGQATAQAFLFPPGVGCDVDFAACAWPPP